MNETKKKFLTNLLAGAVSAKIAAWDAENALEVALGYEGDAVDEYISTLAASSDDVEWINEAVLDEFLTNIGVTL